MTSVGAPLHWKRRISGGARSGMHGLGLRRHAASHTSHPSALHCTPSDVMRATTIFYTQINGLTASRGSNVADTFSVLACGTGPYLLWQRSLKQRHTWTTFASFIATLSVFGDFDSRRHYGIGEVLSRSFTTCGIGCILGAYVGGY